MLKILIYILYFNNQLQKVYRELWFIWSQSLRFQTAFLKEKMKSLK